MFVIKLFKKPFDKNFQYLFLSRLWSIFAGGITLILIPFFYDESQQGLYFTFISILALGVFFELGFNQVINNFVGHEKAFLKFNIDTISGSEYHLNRLTQLTKLIFKYYLIISALFLIIIFTIGYLFFKSHLEDNMSSLSLIWFFLVLFTSFELLLSPFLAFSEGAGLIAKVSRFRLVQSLIGHIGFWICLIVFKSLWSFVILLFLKFLILIIWFFYHGKFLFFLYFRRDISKTKLSWMNEIFPFQWRISISWINGYLIFSLITPFVFSYLGAVEAGRIGYTLLIFQSIMGLSLSAVASKVPIYTSFIAKKKIKSLKIYFRKSIINSQIMYLFFSLSFISLYLILDLNDFYLIKRMSDFSTILIILLNFLILNITMSLSYYIRAFKIDPLAKVTSITSVLIIITLLGLNKYTIDTMFLIIVFINFFVNFLSTLYFYKKINSSINVIKYE